jgi:hypothetical protein
MIVRQYGKIIFECDECGDTFESNTREFDEAWENAKDEGWRAYKEDGEWCHSCPDCGG